MNGDPNKKPWTFIKLRSRLVVKDYVGGGPLFVIESGYNVMAVEQIMRAINDGATPWKKPDEN